MGNINFYNNVLGIEGFIFNILHLVHLAYVHRDDPVPKGDNGDGAKSYSDYQAFGSGDWGLIIHFGSELAPECYMSKKRKYSKLIWFETEGKRTSGVKRIGGVLQCSTGDD